MNFFIARIFRLLFCGIILCEIAPRENLSAETEKISLHALVEQLGHDDYFEREAASAELEKRGMEAFGVLREAEEIDEGIFAAEEIKIRARALLEKLNTEMRRGENPTVEKIASSILYSPVPLDRIWRMQWLTEFSSGLGAKGARTLCRILCFEVDKTMRVESAKILMTLYPAGPKSRAEWFRQINESVPVCESDELITLVRSFAQIAQEIYSLNENKSPLENSPLDEQVRQLTEKVSAFQNRAEYHQYLIGSKNDILIFYSLADLQQRVGMHAESENSLDAAGKIVPQLPARRDEMRPFDMTPESSFIARVDAARVLFARNKLAWAERECQLVIAQNTNTSDHLLALGLSIEIALLREEYESAASLSSRAMKLTHQIPRLNVELYEAEYRLKRDYALALQMFAKNDWQSAHAIIAQAFDEISDSPALLASQIDLLILRYKLAAHIQLDENFTRQTETFITHAIEYLQELIDDLRDHSQLNALAWLLVGTQRELEMAMKCVEASLHEFPENVACLDTLAHIYAAQGDFSRAVETQKQVVSLASEATIFRKTLEQFESQTTHK